MAGSNWCRVGMKSLIGWQQIGLLRSFPFCRPRHTHTNKPLCLRRTSCRPRQDQHHRLSSCLLLPSLCACACARARLSPSLAFSRGFELKLLFNSCYHCWILGVSIVRGLRGQRQRQRKILCVCVCVQGVCGSDELREERAWCHCTMASTGSSTSTAARLLVGERRSLLFPFPRNHDQRRMIHSVAVSNSQDRQLLLRLRRSRRYCWMSTTAANLPLRQDFNKIRRPKRLLNRPPLVRWSPFFSPGFCGCLGRWV